MVDERMEQNLTDFETILKEKGTLVYRNTGTSMMPLLRQNRDLMVIRKRPEGRLNRLDAVLYKRDKQYILHRILKVRENDYVICGDHQYRREYGVTDDQILGVLSGVIRDGETIGVKDFRYQAYVHLWCDLFYLRAAILALKDYGRRAWRKIKRLFSHNAE